MRPIILTLIALATAALIGAAGVVTFGLYNVSARAGHWPGVGWLLHTTFENAVKLRAEGAKAVPDLTAPGLAELGAGHFASACAFCHALPGQSHNATARSMRPLPPHVLALPGDWKPEHLHWIINEGAKMTGMPHWPAAHRADEVWALVAYLERVRRRTPPGTLPSNKDGDLIANCAGCHAPAGQPAIPLAPRLDIQTEAYLTQALDDYRTGARPSGFMQHAVSLLPLDGQAKVLDTLRSRPAASGTNDDVDPDLLDQGKDLALRGTDDVPACAACHGPNPKHSHPLTPAISGQYRPYIKAQLHLWRDGHRRGGPRSELMRKAALDLSDAEIAALAAWYAAQSPASPVSPR